MSRRKLGSRPQHLSTFQDEPEPGDVADSVSEKAAGLDVGDRDLLTCGQCRSTFPLAHILLFIQHKRGRCGGGACLGEEELQAHGPPSPPRRTLMRAPYLANGVLEAVPLDLFGGGIYRQANGPMVKQEALGLDPEEPPCYTCHSCKELFTSAWCLLQHAQHTHGLSIYLEPPPDPRGSPFSL
uniref:C2H2-type domain-containing protein n=1 Tax=Lepisosteus oculatus TaxID=7918 RepID=W5NBL5_LEPOC